MLLGCILNAPFGTGHVVLLSRASAPVQRCAALIGSPRAMGRPHAERLVKLADGQVRGKARGGEAISVAAGLGPVGSTGRMRSKTARSELVKALTVKFSSSCVSAAAAAVPALGGLPA